MYIGPWQEYNLSRARDTQQARQQTLGLSPAITLKSDIERALLTSLDPESAQKALAAMSPLLSTAPQPAQLQQQQPTRLENDHYPANPNPRRKTGRRAHASYLPPVGTNRSQQHHQCQPHGGYSNAQHGSQHITVSSARDRDRERSLHGASPLSVRSVQSEPINGTSSRNSLLSQPHTPNGPAPKASRRASGHVPQLELPQIRSKLSGPSTTTMMSLFPHHQQGQKKNTMHHYQKPKQQFLQSSDQKFAELNADSLYHLQQQHQLQQKQQNSMGFSGTYDIDDAAKPLPHRQPAYNSRAAVNILRVQRTHRSRAEIARLTGWKFNDDSTEGTTTSESGGGSGGGDGSCSGNAAGASRKKSVELSTEQRIEQVNLMKRLYMAKQLEAQAQEEAQAQAQAQAGISTGVGARVGLVAGMEPNHHYVQHLDEKGRVVDLDLTDEEFHRISKYFGGGGGGGAAGGGGDGGSGGDKAVDESSPGIAGYSNKNSSGTEGGGACIDKQMPSEIAVSVSPSHYHNYRAQGQEEVHERHGNCRTALGSSSSAAPMGHDGCNGTGRNDNAFPSGWAGNGPGGSGTGRLSPIKLSALANLNESRGESRGGGGLLLTDSDDPLDGQSGKDFSFSSKSNSPLDPTRRSDLAYSSSKMTAGRLRTVDVHPFAGTTAAAQHQENRGMVSTPPTPTSQQSAAAAVGSNSSYQDELHIGGLEGLLRWSIQLDVDNI